MLTARDEMPLATFARDTGLDPDRVRRMLLKREIAGRQDERGRWYIDSAELDRVRLQQLERFGLDDRPFDIVRAIAQLALPHMDPMFTLDDGTRIDRQMTLVDDLTVRQLGAYQDEARRVGIQFGGSSLFVPLHGLGRAIDTGTSTTGGPFKFTQGDGSFADLLRNRSSVLRAGATVIPGLTGPLRVPRITASGAATWRAENPGSDLAKTDLTTDSGVTLAFKSIQRATSVTRQALFSAASGNFPLQRIIEGDLAGVIAVALDLAALNGAGTSTEPLGVLQDTSVPVVAAGANGAALGLALASQIKREVAEANGDGPNTAWISNPRVREKAEQTAGIGGTASGSALWIDGSDGDGSMLGRRAIASTQVPRNLTKGTASTVCSALAFGVFERMLIGMFGPGLELIVDPFELKLQNAISITAKLHCDVGNQYPAAFRRTLDLLTN